jgi:hypothetical protein
MWAAAAGGPEGGVAAAAGPSGSDLLGARLELLPTPERASRYPDGDVGSVTLTLVAARALSALRAACGSAVV